MPHTTINIKLRLGSKPDLDQIRQQPIDLDTVGTGPHLLEVSNCNLSLLRKLLLPSKTPKLLAACNFSPEAA